MNRDLSAKGRARARVAVISCLGFAALSSGVNTGFAEGTVLTASDPTATGEPEDLLEDEPDAAPAPPPLSLCQTDLRLSGTFFDERAPQRSFASFHVRAERPGGEVYKVGQRVGAFEILRIEPRTVVLDDGGAGCYLKLAGAAVPPPAAPAPKRSKRKRPAKEEKKPEKKAEEKADFTAEELSANIRALGGDKYEIKKELLPKIAQRSAQLRGSTQWTQVRGYSGVLGLRIEKLASDGLLERLGLKTGDMVKTLNGLQLTSLEGALEAQKLISTAPHLNLLIQRDGTPVTLDYRVVP